MSEANYDVLLDEPDELLCAEHERPRPCPLCNFENLEYRADCRREERDGD
jgi:hypothetical protein